MFRASPLFIAKNQFLVFLIHDLSLFLQHDSCCVVLQLPVVYSKSTFNSRNRKDQQQFVDQSNSLVHCNALCLQRLQASGESHAGQAVV